MIARGQVEVLNKRRLRPPELVATLNAGDYLSTFDMLVNDSGELSFRAGSAGPVDMLCITLDSFDHYVSENPTVDHALRKAAQERSPIFFRPQLHKPFWRVGR